MIEKFLCICSIALCLVLPSTSPLAQYKQYINLKGWNLPDPACLPFVRNEKVTYPGVPFDITEEKLDPKPDQLLYINNPLFLVGGSFYPNIFVKEEVLELKIYKTPNGEILCYRYMRIFQGLLPESKPEAAKLPASSMIIDGVQISYIFDLDNDGINESMIDAPAKKAEELKLLISILKSKLGLCIPSKISRGSI